MNAKTLLLALVFALFGAYSVYTMLQVGYLGIWESGLTSLGAFQILLDLVIACGLICVWMVLDARQRGTNPWPYVAITLVSGTFGPLLYLLVRARQPHPGSLTAA